jgi:hypothetical protein
MRQIFSIRFFAAVGAVAGLFLVVLLVQRGDDEITVAPPVVAPSTREIDYVDWVYTSTAPDFEVRNGRAAADTQLVIDDSRQLAIKRGTLGEQHCPRWGEVVGCAFLADLLGEAVVWFAIVPMGPNRTVPLPAIDTLEDGVATLVNGWQMPYAPILDRLCGDDDYSSYRELRDTLGDNFTSVYSIDEQRLVAVQCNARVAYAPPPATSVPESSPSMPSISSTPESPSAATAPEP